MANRMLSSITLGQFTKYKYKKKILKLTFTCTTMCPSKCALLYNRELTQHLFKLDFKNSYLNPSYFNTTNVRQTVLVSDHDTMSD